MDRLCRRKRDERWLLAYATLAGTGVLEWGRQQLGLGSPADLAALAATSTHPRPPMLLPGAGLALGQTDSPMKKETAPATKPAKALKFTGIVRDKQTHKPIEGATVTVHREIANNPTRWETLAMRRICL